ncbi:hypothetical protein IBTHAUMO2_470016 [Nitrosopumilaceae archaeon]|nr:hypothetical protein IBTHAUMO2_470016 [Nitrosopumilaceae archaeon]
MRAAGAALQAVAGASPGRVDAGAGSRATCGIPKDAGGI